MEHITLHLPERRPNAQATCTFSLVKRYIERSESSAYEVATTLGRALNDENLCQPRTDQWFPPTQLHIIFAAILYFARQIPFGHSYHQRLIALLEAFRGQPDLTPQVAEVICNIRGLSEFEWAYLPSFGEQAVEIWNSEMPVGQEDDERSLSIPEWTNFNTFIASFVAQTDHARGDLALGLQRIGFDIIDFTLGDGREDTIVANNIPAAAIWILIAGHWIYEHIAVAHDTVDRDALWGQWKGKLYDISQDDTFDEKVRDWAGKAASRIAEGLQTFAAIVST